MIAPTGTSTHRSLGKSPKALQKMATRNRGTDLAARFIDKDNRRSDAA